MATAGGGTVKDKRRSLPWARLRSPWLLLTLLVSTTLVNHGRADVVDPADSLPSRWRLGDHDCNARIVGSTIEPNGGHDGRPCERIRLNAGHGSRLLLQYRLPPSRVITELNGSAWLLAAAEGVRVGFRVHYPYLRDPTTGRAVSTIVFGDTYRKKGQWQQLRVASIASGMRARESALRIQYGPQSDLRDAFVDAFVVDVYNGPGSTTVLLDDLRVEQMVPVGSVGGANRQGPDSTGELPAPTDLPRRAQGLQPRQEFERLTFPRGNVTRIIEHNGEPLEWLHRLGFDAVLLSKSADADILREASQAGMRIYCPPPTAIQPELEPLLEPVEAWYLGTSLDESAWEPTVAEVRRLEKLPNLWRRPHFAAPAEKWSRFATRMPAIVYDLPPSIVGLSGDEESSWVGDQIKRTRRSVQMAVGIQTTPPDALVNQLTAMSRGIGAPTSFVYQWHPIWLQTMRALEHCPRAILFRSSTPLTSGESADHRRSLALGFVNRVIKAVGPLVASSSPGDDVVCRGVDYRGRQLRIGNTQLLLVSIASAPATEPLSGDEARLEINLPHDAPSQFAWRLTSFAPERLEVRRSSNGGSVEIVSPDFAEWVVVSDDASLGIRLDRAIGPLAQTAAIDRWQLCSESVFQSREDWRAAAAGRIVSPDEIPTEMMIGAANALAEGERMFRSGNAAGSMHLIKKADAWGSRSHGRLTRAIQPKNADHISFPPVHAADGIGLQLTMLPQLADNGWSRNRLAGGSLDSATVLHRTGWTYDQRIEATAQSQVEIAEGIARSGSGCLRVEVTGAGDGVLPGGYAGTAVRVRSPVVDFSAGQAVCIDAHVRTLGFGSPYQGVLVYDSIGGPELGVLVRGADRWKHIRLIRQTFSDAPVRVIFEVIGGGQALIDDVQVSNWQSEPSQDFRFRPISPQQRSPAFGANARSDDVLPNPRYFTP